MKQKSARVLLVLSAIFVLAGMVVIDPMAGLSAMIFAGALSSIAAALDAKGVRYTALVLLAVAASTAVWRYPEAKRFYESYRQHVLETSAESQEEPTSQ